MGQKIPIKTKHQDIPVLRTKGLGKTYPNGTRALKNVDFTIQRDEFVSIIGSSGAGKSTFLRCLNRLITPTEGLIELNGKDITYGNGAGLKKVRQRVGMIFQQFNLVPRLSVLSNVLAGRLRFNQGPISYGSSIIRLFSQLEKEIAFECLKQVGIEHLAFQRADTLSGGQQQRVAIARTLAQEPDVFLADEPISSLDPHSAEKVMEIMRQINQNQKIPVIVNLHHIDFALRYGRRIVGMADGEMIFDGKGEDMSPDTVAWIYQGREGGETERIRAYAVAG
ncbi:MAG: phosphonate ABC transporter ATP-binding protein [Thermodesulfobacteriota bacterium]|nr:phosphonate ABC transporter ATP-binding protein [Thermodesulfobacteriota bacterium]